MKKVVIGILVACLIGGFVAYKMFNKPHRDIDAESAVATVSADDLFADFEADEAAANASYLDQVIEVSGTIDEVSEDAEGNTVVILAAETAMMGGVSATIDPSVSEFSASPGAAITLKGRCTGMLMDVVLTNCFPVE
ncbi:MAG: hypothetical protein ACI9FU_000297 [Granulosicoccus sp.]|jgi:hypothetical protein